MAHRACLLMPSAALLAHGCSIFINTVNLNRLRPQATGAYGPPNGGATIGNGNAANGAYGAPPAAYGAPSAAGGAYGQPQPQASFNLNCGPRHTL